MLYFFVNLQKMNKIYTLEQFFENSFMPDGLYAIWVDQLIYDETEILNGISGCISIFSEMNGFEDLPEWVENFEDNQIKVKFLEELAID